MEIDLNAKARPTVTELVLKNGMVLAVMGTRLEVMDKIKGPWEEWIDKETGKDNGYFTFPEFAEFDVASVLDEGSPPARYTLRCEEIVVIGSERVSNPLEDEAINWLGTDKVLN